MTRQQLSREEYVKRLKLAIGAIVGVAVSGTLLVLNDWVAGVQDEHRQDSILNEAKRDEARARAELDQALKEYRRNTALESDT